MQPRFERRSANSALALVGQPRFRAGYDFLRLRADSGELAPELADWWEDFHLGDSDEREALLQDVRAAAPPRARRAPAAAPDAEPEAANLAVAPGAAEGEGQAAPRRRRRRRRRPSGGAGEGPAPASE
jgi:poly(A) polymerase